MKSNHKYTLLVCASCLFVACTQETIDLYELDESKVYFQAQSFTGSNGAAGYSTSTTFSFVDKDPNWTEVVFRGTVQLLGESKDYDRQVKIEVDKAATTMVEGEGFEVNLDTLAIKAGAAQAQIGVRFFRTKALREKSDTLVLHLLPNENFNVLETYKASNVWSNTSAKEIDGSRWTFVLSEIYTRPSRWSTAKADNYFGSWNVTKYVFINAFFGFTTEDWEWATGKIAAGRMHYYARELQKELQRRADEGNPVIDEDGSYMQLPDAYHVDYSNVITQ